MTTQFYGIKPLKWKREFNDYQQVYQSDAAHGDYKVARYRDPCEEHDRCQIDSHGEWRAWYWEYCFAEYKNEASVECASPKEGKAAAEAHWQEYLIAGLEVIDQPSTE